MCLDSLERQRCCDFDLTSRPYTGIAQALIRVSVGAPVSFVLQADASDGDLTCHRHFGLYLGQAWLVKAGTVELEPVHLVSHLIGGEQRLASFHDLALRSTALRVYQCDCSAEDRDARISQCFLRYRSLAGGCCSALIRQIVAVAEQPVVVEQVKQKFLRMTGWISASLLGTELTAGASWLIKRLRRAVSASEPQCSILDELPDPLADWDQSWLLGLVSAKLEMLEVTFRPLGTKIRVSPRCSRDFTGENLSSCQVLLECLSCGIVDPKYICRHCAADCHADCRIRRLKEAESPNGYCDCQHRQIEALEDSNTRTRA